MEREEYMETKRKEIQEEVTFLLEEKNETRKKSLELYMEVRDKISEINSLANKEKDIISRVKSIKESGASVYRVDTYEFIYPLINQSLSDLQKLATSTFGAEDFGEIPKEEKVKGTPYKSPHKLQEESNALIIELIETIKEVGDNNVSTHNLKAKALLESYNGGPS